MVTLAALEIAGVPDCLVDIPAMAVSCSMVGAVGKKWSEEASQDMEKLVSGKQFVVRVEDEVALTVKLIPEEVDRLQLLGQLPTVLDIARPGQYFFQPEDLKAAASLCADDHEISPDSILIYFDDPKLGDQLNLLKQIECHPHLAGVKTVELGSLTREGCDKLRQVLSRTKEQVEVVIVEMPGGVEDVFGVELVVCDGGQWQNILRMLVDEGYDCVEEDQAGMMMVGGGAQGGKRTNAGRKSQSGVQWKNYKKIGKKESVNLAGKNKSIKSFFVVSNKVEVEDETEPISSENKVELEDETELNSSEQTLLVGEWVEVLKKSESNFTVRNLQYFKNGCFAKPGEKLGSVSNYSCAIDTFINMGEAICLSGNYVAVEKILGFSPLL